MCTCLKNISVLNTKRMVSEWMLNILWHEPIKSSSLMQHQCCKSLRRNDPHVSQARRKAVAVGTQFEPVFCAYTPHCLIPRQSSIGWKNLKCQQYQTHAKNSFLCWNAFRRLSSRNIRLASQLCFRLRMWNKPIRSSYSQPTGATHRIVLHLTMEADSSYGTLRVLIRANCFGIQHSVHKFLQNWQKTESRQFVSIFP